MSANLRKCYGTLVGKGWVGAEELPLLDAWLEDFAASSVAAAGEALQT